MGDLRRAAAAAGAKFLFLQGAVSISDQEEGNHQAENPLTKFPALLRFSM